MNRNQVFMKLPDVLLEGQYFAAFRKGCFGGSTLFDDDLCYYWLKKEKTEGGEETKTRMKPRQPPPQVFDDGTVRRSISNHISGNIERIVICHDVLDFVIYTVLEKVTLASLVKRKKISEQLKEKVQDALKHRTEKDARKYLLESGVDMPKKKISNQSRNVASRLKSLKGPVPINVEESLSNFAVQQETAHFAINSETKLWRYIEIFKKPIELFVNNCPKRKHVESFRADIPGLDAVESFEETKSKLLSLFDGGYCSWSSVIELDTTFEFGNFNLTYAIGYTTHFTTRSSGKPRPIILAAMAHQSKEKEEHQNFARLLANALNEADRKSDRCVTAFVTDNEASFSEYLKFDGILANTKHVKCGLHLKANFFRDLKKYLNEEMTNRIFGKKHKLDNGEEIIKKCLLSSLNKQEFDRRFQRSEGKLHKKCFKWIKKRKETLYNDYSMRAQFQGLICKQYSTTNIIENLNGKLKTIINLNSTAVETMTQFSDFVEDEYRQFVCSILEDNVENPVRYYKFKNHDEPQSEQQKVNCLLRAGFTEADLSLYDIPFKLRNLLPRNMRGKCLSGLLDFEVNKCDRKFFVRKDNSSYCISKIDSGEWICDCSKSNKFIACIHTIRAFCSMEEKERKSNFSSVIEKLNNESIMNTKRRLREYRFGSKNPKRKFSQYSSNNEKRQVNHIDQICQERVIDEYTGLEALFENSSTNNQVVQIEVADTIPDYWRMYCQLANGEVTL